MKGIQATVRGEISPSLEGIQAVVQGEISPGFGRDSGYYLGLNQSRFWKGFRLLFKEGEMQLLVDFIRRCLASISGKAFRFSFSWLLLGFVKAGTVDPSFHF